MKALTPTARRAATGRLTLITRVAFVFVFALTPSLGATSLRAQGPAVRMETFRLRPNGRVQIENLRGSTRVETWEDQTVRIVAEKASPPGRALEPSELLLMSAQNTVMVECRQTGAPGRIDVTVYAPRGAQLHITGGAFPVEVSGSLASAVIATTNGAINYRIPVSEDAQLSMHSARGSVRSAISLNSSGRTGAQSLQGRLGNGSAPIILESQSGNITLTPGAPLPTIARAYDDRLNDRTSDAQAGNYPQEPRAVDPRSSSRRNSGSQQGASRQTQSRRNDAPVQDDGDPDDSSAAGSQNPANATSGTGSTGPGYGMGNAAVFAGTSRGVDSSSVTKRGPLNLPREEKSSSDGNSGLTVRIIPSNTALGPPRPSRGSVYDQNNQDDSAMTPGRPSQRSDSNRSGSGYDPAPSASSGGQPRPSSQYSRQPSIYDSRSSEPDPADTSAAGTGAGARRPNQPPVLRRDDAGEPDGAAGAGGTARENASDDEAIVLKSALVNLNVTVMNRSGAAFPDLKKEDFRVLENGQPQRVEFFAPATAPFNLVLLLDLSGSIQDKIDIVKSAALRFIDVLGPQDKVAVVTFTDQVRVMSQLTSDRETLRKRIKAIERPAGATTFYEAMWFSLTDTLRGLDGQRNAIVVMTDGVDSSLDRRDPYPTRVSFERLAHRLEEADCIVFPIYLDTEYEEVFERGQSSSEAYAIARDQLSRIADLTGGLLFKAEKASDLSGVYKQVAAAIRTVYSVGYYPANAERDGTFRRVKVSVDRPDAAVRTRKGYYAK